jgi:tetratricopeptide (TPR) repeat protein
MNTTSAILVSSVLAGFAGAAVATLLRPAATDASEPSGVGPDQLQLLNATIAEIRKDHERMAAELRDAEMQSDKDSSRVSMGDIESAVQRYMAKHAGEAGLEEVAEQSPRSLEDIVAILDSGELSDAQLQVFWQQLAKEGHADAVQELYEQRVEEDPNNPDKRVDLGRLYLERIQEVGNGPMAGEYAMQADAAFDKALEIDDHHWEARFTKAVSYSFWPPVFGKQPAAIQQFETLVGQQAGAGQEPHHAQTHLLLGNMYQQLGRHADALGAWQAGLEVFPDNPQLAQQIALASGSGD